MPLNTVEVEEIDWFKGVAYPRGVRFREIIITGPPSSGKTTLVQKLGGWPEEGYIDLAQDHWWRSRILTFRPREVHFGIPFRGVRESLSVFDPAWLAAPAPVDLRAYPDTTRQELVFPFQLAGTIYLRFSATPFGTALLDSQRPGSHHKSPDRQDVFKRGRRAAKHSL